MSAVIDGLRYDTEKSQLIASDAYWDGSNWERRGRNKFLFLTENGRYFVQVLTRWQGERDHLEALTQDAAITLWENDLPEHEVEFEKAFPGVEIKEA